MLRAWRKQRSCRQPESPEAWLRQITRREVFRLADRARVGREIVDDELALRARSSPDGIDDLVDRLDVQRALGKLAPEERMLLNLRYERDMTQRKAADALGIPEGTAKVRLHRVRQRLARYMKQSPA